MVMLLALLYGSTLPSVHGLISPIRYTKTDFMGHPNRLWKKMIRSASMKVSSLTSSSLDGLTEDDKQQSKFDWEAQWYPIIPFEYLEDKPVALTVMNKDLVIWKNNQEIKNMQGNDKLDDYVSVMLDSCPHRLAPLSSGTIVSNDKNDISSSSCGNCSLKCRYHGWEFTKDGSCSKLPMLTKDISHDPTEIKSKNRRNIYAVQSFPSRVVNGLVWAYLNSQISEKDLPKIPNEDEFSKIDMSKFNWMMVLNPISYPSMIENSFDPAHAPFTHEGMGFGLRFSPEIAIPMTKYETMRFDDKGFKLSHTPYQQSPAQTGSEVETQREFVPPSTVIVNTPPFFSTTLWFVPSTPMDTNVLGIAPRFMKPNPFMKLIQMTKSKKLIEITKDFYYTEDQLQDSSYRFMNQDRLIMQGQDKRKWNDGSRVFDIFPTISDNGVKVYQQWIQKYGSGGPFPSTSHSSNKFLTNVRDGTSFHRELSFWERSGKFHPQIRRMAKFYNKLSKKMERISKTSISGSIVMQFLIQALLSKSNSNNLSQGLKIMSTLLFAVGAMSLALEDWSHHKLRKLYGTGDEIWQKTLETYASSE